MFDISDCDRIRSTHGDAVIVDPAELIGLAEYLESDKEYGVLGG